EAVAVCFLHAWANPAHEQRAAAAASARLPRAYVTTSSDVLPEIKEFERFSTTVANALVGPLVRDYLARLAARLRAEGLPAPPLIMHSHGGVAAVAETIRLAAATALSGPAGGVAAAVALARASAAADLVTFDMGGTSTDIALVRGGAAALSTGRTVGAARIALPSLDIVTLGAGGGSIAAVGADGLLRVGPQSAGAVPGPACYGSGGTAATVTDANLVLGLLDAGNFLGGTQRLDQAAAQRALAALGASLGLDAVAAAAGVHRVVNARMADGVRVATVRRGVDPRRSALLAFGGAAGLHATAVAAELGMTRVVVPVQASVLSAWGMLNSDLRVQGVRSLTQTARGLDPLALAAAFAAMEQEGRTRLAGFGLAMDSFRSAEMRYGEQVFEIEVDLDGLDLSAPDAAAAIAARFHARHEALFTYALPDEAVVAVSARLATLARLPPALAVPAPAATGATARRGVRRACLGGAWQEVPVHAFEALGDGASVAGPALIDSATTTVLLRPGETARFDARGWLLATVA
ncbi:MAG: hydantoinase/oxoprolinase family protein, partial [Rhodospirillales bacterium]|nr:hydantoinase/oxoprolinase family protein [Rhodospirillales bacterium]